MLAECGENTRPCIWNYVTTLTNIAPFVTPVANPAIV